MKSKNVTKEQYFDRLAAVLERRGLKISRKSLHRYHIQFVVSCDAGECMVQIFESKKGTHPRVLNDIGGCEDEVRAAIEEMGGRLPLGSRSAGSRDADGIAGKSIIGTDESGKGDYFGPLVIAGVFVPADGIELLLKAGVRDSKRLSDNKARTTAQFIESNYPHAIIVLPPQEYNEMHARIGNVNKILGQGHARVIEELLDEVECDFALTDQFGDKSFVERELMEKGAAIRLEQRPRAEEIPAVAAASVIARAKFLDELDSLSVEYGAKLPKGASAAVDAAGREFVRAFGAEELKKVAKFHFKNTSRIV